MIGIGRGGLPRRVSRALTRLGLLAATPPRALEPLSLFLVALVGFSLLFMAFPAIDLSVSDLFYGDDGGFLASRDPFLKALRKSSDLVLAGLVAGLLARLCWGLVRQGFRVFMTARRSCYLLVALALGPGLLVNALLKPLWGRPRPISVDQFGGDAPYQSVWRMSEWCQSNCSFVSGEASSSIWFVAALVLVPARYRTAVGIPVVTYALLLSANRIAFGGHFVSDVVLSWLISGLAFSLLYRLMVSAPGIARRTHPGRAPVPALA